jgi:hypothetical protein
VGNIREKVIAGNVDACAVHEESTVFVPATGEMIPNVMQSRVSSLTSIDVAADSKRVRYNIQQIIRGFFTTAWVVFELQRNNCFPERLAVLLGVRL